MSEGYREIVVKSGEKGKGRSFRAAVLAMASAPVWDKHEATYDKVRPVFITLGCQAQEASPIMANLRSGNVALMMGEGLLSKGTVLDMLKSVRYAWGAQRVPLDGDQNGVVLTARLASLLAIDPGLMEPDEPVRFLIAPPRARLEEELLRLPAREMRLYGERLASVAFEKGDYHWSVPDLKRADEVWHFAPAMALWFCSMVDRRVSVPILPDPLFQMRLYIAALRSGIAGWGRSDRGSSGTWGRRGPELKEWGYGSVGLAPGVACSATQDGIKALLVEEVRAWNEEQQHMRDFDLKRAVDRTRAPRAAP